MENKKCSKPPTRYISLTIFTELSTVNSQISVPEKNDS